MSTTLQMEWDLAAYIRKFHQTLAYIKIGDQPPCWKWISTITDQHYVYENPREKPLGQVVMECQNGQICHDEKKYPVVQFLYRGILPGVYRSLAIDNVAYYLTKRHLKSYKIGLSDETHTVRSCVQKGVYDRVSKDIDLNNPIKGYFLGGHFEVFSPKVVRIGTNLFADGDSIGFMEGDTCMLRNNAFLPLIKPLLEHKWQIAN